MENNFFGIVIVIWKSLLFAMPVIGFLGMLLSLLVAIEEKNEFRKYFYGVIFLLSAILFAITSEDSLNLLVEHYSKIKADK